MADLSDVADAIVTIATQAVYPNGAGRASIVGQPIALYQGWPSPQSLDQDMPVGKAHVTVFPRPGDTVTSTVMGDGEWIELSNDGAKGTAARELRRQTKQFQITIWAPTPQFRDALAKVINPALSAASRLEMPDGSQATMTFVNEAQRDESQKVLIYRRDLFFAVNFATVQTDTASTILQTITNTTAGPTETADGPTIHLTLPSA